MALGRAAMKEADRGDVVQSGGPGTLLRRGHLSRTTVAVTAPWQARVGSGDLHRLGFMLA